MSVEAIESPAATSEDDHGQAWSHAAATARRDALAEIVADHGETVHAVAHHLCGPVVAARVSRDAFVELWRHPVSLDADGPSVRSRLLGIVHRAAGGADPGVLQPDDPLLLRRLPGAERAVIALVLHGRCTIQEAAGIVGQSEEQVRSMIRSGLLRLRAVQSDGVPVAPLHDPNPPRLNRSSAPGGE